MFGILNLTKNMYQKQIYIYNHIACPAFTPSILYYTRGLPNVTRKSNKKI